MLRHVSAVIALSVTLGFATATAPTQAEAALPTVNMAAVDAAAHVEGKLGNRRSLGDDSSTRLIQRALRAKGFRVNVNGTYDRTTTAAYARYQRSLGYSGINANGVPGLASLTKLGARRFTIKHKVVTGNRNDRYSGRRVNTRTRQMLAAADRRVPWKITVTQGSYCTFTGSGCASASAGTHDGGGVVDLRVSNLNSTQRWRTVQAMRKVGFAAWLRTPSQCGGCWPAHIHAIAIGDTDIWQRNGSLANRDQVAAYLRGRDGLARNGADNTPGRYRTSFTWWERYSGR